MQDCNYSKRSLSLAADLARHCSMRHVQDAACCCCLVDHSPGRYMQAIANARLVRTRDLMSETRSETYSPTCVDEDMSSDEFVPHLSHASIEGASTPHSGSASRDV